MFNYVVPPRVTFGAGAGAQIGDELTALGAKSVLCVYDPGVKAAGIVDRLLDPIRGTFKLVEFGEVEANPPDTSVYKALEGCKDAAVDAIVVIGGGSAMDTAKAVNILLTNGGKLDDYEGPNRVSNPGKPLIAIPTTAGTSSEITYVAVIANEAQTRKMVILGRNVGPTVALIDPELTYGLPPAITAATGMDAMTHAIESYLSVNASPLTGYNSLEAVRILTRALPTAFANGQDKDARQDVMLACVIVGFAFNNADLGMVHAIAHTLSSHFGVAHGVANAALLPHVMRFNAETSAEKLRDVAGAMGIDTAGMSAAQAAAAAAAKVADLCRTLAIPSLEAVGVRREKFSQLADETLKEGALMFNPRQPTHGQVVDILQQAF